MITFVARCPYAHETAYLEISDNWFKLAEDKSNPQALCKHCGRSMIVKRYQESRRMDAAGLQSPA